MDANVPVPVPIIEREGCGDKGTTPSGCGEAEHSYLGWGTLKG